MMPSKARLRVVGLDGARREAEPDPLFDATAKTDSERAILAVARYLGEERALERLFLSGRLEWVGAVLRGELPDPRRR